MKEIKDYLHLYLGCHVMLDDGNTYQLKPSNIPNNWQSLQNPIHGKLIIRPLSDMTEEECFEYNQISATMFSLNKLQDQMKTEAATVLFLLSNHFDLFGLLEAGLAIDKTTLKQSPMSNNTPVSAGSLTDKGVVEKIVYLTFNYDTPTGSYSDKMPTKGKGLVCGQIGNKAFPIGELKLISNE